ncbi:MAG TPA: ribonuclease P protein component [Balneolaceae bacterium]|nr:ribonuclease P protein component [Balneolaceae bacterium]
MPKGQNKQSSARGDDFSLPRAKILRGRKNFDRLFENDAHFCRGKNINLRYKIVDDSSFGCQMAFIVTTKLGKANKRNRTRRLIKEAYRLHQHLLYTPLQKATITFHGAFMAKTVDLVFAEAEQDVIRLLEQVRVQLPAL